MINELKVFYKGDKGLITFKNKKTIFQHREDREGVKEGLGVIDEAGMFDKGNYAFAVFKNVATVVPKDYDKVNFYHNKGVPLKMEKGVYGDNVLIKESYKDRTYIRAYREDGSIGLYESEIIKNADYEGPNVYFKRLDDLVKDWVDITDETVASIIKSVSDLSCDVDIQDEAVQAALKGLSHNRICKLASGVYVADGRFESLVIWSENKEVKMAWLGRMLDLNNYDFEVVSNATDEEVELTDNTTKAE